MQSFLSKAAHNKNFLDCIEGNFPDDFYDWRITSTFYIAIHLLKALAKKRNVDLGHSHEDIARNIGIYNHARPIMPFPPGMREHYKRLWHYSREARYYGFIDHNLAMEIQKDNYKECIKHFNALQAYFKGQQIFI